MRRESEYDTISGLIVLFFLPINAILGSKKQRKEKAYEHTMSSVGQFKSR